MSKCGCLSTPDLHFAVGTQLRDDIIEGVRESAFYCLSWDPLDFFLLNWHGEENVANH